MIKRITEDLETGEVKSVRELPSFLDLPEAAQRLIKELLLDEDRREFYRDFLGDCSDDFPLSVVYVEDPKNMRPLTEEETAWAQNAIDEYQKRLDSGEKIGGTVTRFEFE